MLFDADKRNLYMTTAIIGVGLSFMLLTGYYIVENTENSNSREMAVDQRIDDCYAKKGLD